MTDVVEDVIDGALRVRCTRLGVVLAPDGSAEEMDGVLNPGIARDRDGRLVMYARRVAAGNVSRIGIAVATDALEPPRFERRGNALVPATDDERRTEPGGYGCEDPRVTFVPVLDRYVMAYCAFGPHGPRIALAASRDGYRWQRHGRIVFDGALDHVPNKDAAFFPEPVRSPDGIVSLALYHRPMLRESFNGQAPIALMRALPPEQREVTCLAYVPLDAVQRDLAALTRVRESVPVIPIGAEWGGLKNGCGTPPLRTPAGWLSFFHGVDARDHADGTSTLFYRAGIVMHELERPDRLVHRSSAPVLAPRTADERFGVVDDVVFPTGIDPLGEGRYDVYYGAGDARIALVRLDLAYDGRPLDPA